MSRPNIVIFISHDTGRFLSTYGYDTVNTPNYEKLAKSSMKFDRCFCTTPLCAPARSALLTGTYPHQNGMNGLPSDTLGNWDMVTKDRHIAAVLKENGYRTILSGFEHETQDFFSVGFEESIHGYGAGNNGGLPLAGTGDDIDKWLTANTDAGHNTPFYMQIGCTDTHRDWTKYADAYDEKGIWNAPYLIDDPIIDEEMSQMQGASNVLDDGVGDILSAFAKHNMMDNTIFVFTTDHGIDFPRAKGTLFDPGVEVLLFMRYGDRWNCSSSDALISHIDVYPTVLEAASIPIPKGTTGKSFLHILKGDDTAINDTIYMEKTYHDNYDPMRALRTDRYKYILNMDAQTMYDVRIATAPRYNWFKYPFHKTEREELYDLQNDPIETINLATNPEYRELCDKFKEQLAKRMRETNDPLLNGPMASPYHLRVIDEMNKLSE